MEEGWAPGGGPGSPEKGPGGSPPASLPRGREGGNGRAFGEDIWGRGVGVDIEQRELV